MGVRAVIFANANKPMWKENVTRFRDMFPFFVDDQSIYTDSIEMYPPGLVCPPGLVIVFGGDGTMLHAAREVGRYGDVVPILGINRGKLGYLTTFTMNDVIHRDPHLTDAVQSPQEYVIERMMLKTSLRGEHYVHMNDVVIRDPFRSISLRVLIDGNELGLISGDGLIISTPTGSTAYNLSAGGPIMLPRARGIILTPICPHALTYRPLIVPPDSNVRVICETVYPNDTVVIIDGQETQKVELGQNIEVTVSETPAHIVRHPQQNAWHNLTTKLHWGEPNGE